MKKQRSIKVYEQGKMIYEGDDNRAYFEDYRKGAFGLSVPEWIKIVTYIVMLLIFLIKTDSRISRIEETQNIMARTIERLVDFSQNSDNWHSAKFQTLFKGGAPVNGYDNEGRRRN